MVSTPESTEEGCLHHVRRGEITDYQTYEDEREEFRRAAMAVKAPRRIHLGDHLTFLFENHDTMRYQIQEIMRAEKIVREDALPRSWRPTTVSWVGPANSAAPSSSRSTMKPNGHGCLRHGSACRSTCTR